MVRRNYLSKDFDWMLVVAMLLLMILGLLVIYSTTRAEDFQPTRNIVVFQGLWIVISLGVFLFFIIMPYRLIYALSYILYVLGILLLVYTLLWGKIASGSRSWIDLKIIQFQPSEFMKIATVLALARYLSSKKHSIERPMDCIIPFLIVLLPVLLIIKQPDAGTAMVVTLVLIPIIYWAGLSSFWLFLILAPGISAILASGVLPGSSTIIWIFFMFGVVFILYLFRLPITSIGVIFLSNIIVGVLSSIVYSHLPAYQQQRIVGFLNPERYAKTSGYHLIQSKIAVGSGGFFGKGFLNGWHTKLGFLPVQHNDFIFCVISEELGLIGGAILLFFFGFIIFRAISLAAVVKDKFASIASVGFAFIFVIHVFINIGMTIGLFPITGIPLPFISYGGSSLLANTIMVGFLINFGLNRYEY